MLPIQMVETERDDFDGTIVEMWRGDDFICMVFPLRFVRLGRESACPCCAWTALGVPLWQGQCFRFDFGNFFTMPLLKLFSKTLCPILT